MPPQNTYHADSLWKRYLEEGNPDRETARRTGNIDLPQAALGGLQSLGKPSFDAANDPTTSFPNAPINPPINGRAVAIPPPRENPFPNLPPGLYDERADIIGAPPVRGGMQWSGGKSLGNEPALEGLKAASAQPNLLPDSEVTRMAFRDPGTVAPGANEYWGGVLKDRVGDEDFASQMDQKHQEMVMAGLTAQHPAVSAAAEAEARQKALPAMMNSQATLSAAQIGGQARMGAAQIGGQNSERANLSRQVESINAAIGRIAGSAQGATSDGQAIVAALRKQSLALMAQLAAGGQ
jgi:hypothetical protein